jgi:hypothetical protein
MMPEGLHKYLQYFEWFYVLEGFYRNFEAGAVVRTDPRLDELRSASDPAPREY